MELINEYNLNKFKLLFIIRRKFYKIKDKDLYYISEYNNIPIYVEEDIINLLKIDYETYYRLASRYDIKTIVYYQDGTRFYNIYFLNKEYIELFIKDLYKEITKKGMANGTR